MPEGCKPSLISDAKIVFTVSSVKQKKDKIITAVIGRIGANPVYDV